MDKAFYTDPEMEEDVENDDDADCFCDQEVRYGFSLWIIYGGDGRTS